MKLFSGTASRELGKRVANALGIVESSLEVHVFPDGEKRIRVEERVVDEHTIVVQTTSSPVDQNYMELFFIVDALKRSGASSVTVVSPYVGYQRQDHIFRDGEAVSMEVIMETLEAVGVTRLIAFDLHTARIPELFHIPVVHLSALPLFASKIKDILAGRNDEGQSNTVLVSPDMGGIRRIKKLSELLDSMPYASIVKNRDLASGKVTSDEVEGDLKKRAIIVDDMISSGGTIVAAADLLRKKGVEEIIVFATHPVFSKEAPKLLEDSLVKKVYVTDTIEVPKDKQFAKLEVLSIAQMVAQAVSQK